MIRHGRTTWIFALALPLLFLGGCEAPDEGEPDAATEQEGEAAVTPAEPMPHAVTSIQEVDGSGVRGEAMGIHSDETVVIALELEGLAEGREYPAHIHLGSCASGGPVAVPLNPVMGLEDGTGSSTTMIEPDELPANESHFVQVHGEGGAPIACGDMEDHPEHP